MHGILKMSLEKCSRIPLLILEGIATNGTPPIINPFIRQILMKIYWTHIIQNQQFKLILGSIPFRKCFDVNIFKLTILIHVSLLTHIYFITGNQKYLEAIFKRKRGKFNISWLGDNKMNNKGWKLWFTLVRNKKIRHDKIIKGVFKDNSKLFDKESIKLWIVKLQISGVERRLHNKLF